MLDHILDVIAPHICCACGLKTGVLCSHCKYDIISEGYDCCIVCAKPSAASNMCGACRPGVAYDDAWVLGERRGGLQAVIDQYKFKRVRTAASVLAELLDMRLPQLPPTTIIAYIPTISSHRRQRGYDHMQRVAWLLARRRGLTVAPLLTRRTSLPQRAASSRAERLLRQDGAFVAARVVSSPVLLLDDVYTTGATITAGVTALRAVSDQPIFVAVAARQPFDR